MGLTDKIADTIVSKTLKKETVRLPYYQIVEMVKNEFIAGADDAFLKEVLKTAKGGSLVMKRLLSKNERYLLCVNTCDVSMLTGFKRAVFILDNEENKYYQMDKDRYWMDFYKAVKASIEMEKINRTK